MDMTKNLAEVVGTYRIYHPVVDTSWSGLRDYNPHFEL
jgi:hypothetical protein